MATGVNNGASPERLNELRNTHNWIGPNGRRCGETTISTMTFFYYFFRFVLLCVHHPGTRSPPGRAAGVQLSHASALIRSSRGPRAPFPCQSQEGKRPGPPLSVCGCDLDGGMIERKRHHLQSRAISVTFRLPATHKSHRAVTHACAYVRAYVRAGGRQVGRSLSLFLTLSSSVSFIPPPPVARLVLLPLYFTFKQLFVGSG